MGVNVIASASILQARLTRNIPPVIGERLTGLATDAQRAIQFTRSTPGITTALVGMGRAEHVLVLEHMPAHRFRRLRQRQRGRRENNQARHRA